MKGKTIKPFRISKDLVGAGRFERPTPCAQGIGMGSKGSIHFHLFLTFTTIWEICSSLEQ